MAGESDHLPACPRCGELNAPGWRVCETCGAFLLQDDAERDRLLRFEYVRQLRHLSPPVDRPDGPVDDPLLDADPVTEVTSRDDPPARATGDRVARLGDVPTPAPSGLVDSGST